MNKRRWAVALIAAALMVSLLLAGCGKQANQPQSAGSGSGSSASDTPAAAEPAAQPEKVTLRIATVYTPDHPFGPAIAEIIDNFTAEHPEVTVEKEFMPGEQLKTKLQVDLAADNLPEIFVVYTGNAWGEMDMAQNGKMLDLTEYLDADTEWKDGFIAGALDNYKYGLDGVYAAPIGAFGTGFFYNKELFQEAGVTPPKTYAELLEAVDKLNAAGITPWAIGNADTWRSEHLFSILSLKINGEQTMKDVGARKLPYNTPDVLEAFDKMTELANAGAFGKNYIGLNYAGEVAEFNNGKAAMRFSGSWTVGEVSGADAPAGFSDKVGFFPFPGIDGKEATQHIWFGGTSDAYAISSKVQGYQKEMAIELVKALTRSESAKLISETAHDLTAVKADVDPEKAGPLIAEVTKAMSTASGFGNEFAAYETDKAVNSKLYEMTQAVLAGHLTPEEAAVQLDDEVAKNQ